MNGQQTLSENIADVAGLMVAYDAYRLSLNGKPDVVKDGFTGDQRFFISFGQSWRSKVRDAELRREIATDGHAPEQYRADTVRNLDALVRRIFGAAVAEAIPDAEQSRTRVVSFLLIP